jgi:hypothetical protein
MTKLLVAFRNFAKSPTNVSGKSSLENQNTHLMFYNFFSPKIVSFIRQCGKILLSLADHWRQYGASALHAGYKHTRRIWNTYCFSTPTTAARTRSMLRYSACLVNYLAQQSGCQYSEKTRSYFGMKQKAANDTIMASLSDTKECNRTNNRWILQVLKLFCNETFLVIIFLWYSCL